MFASAIEAAVLRVCGRYVKNFSKENIDVGVSGTINLKNIHIKTEELRDALTPYRPVKAFIGSIFADIPIVLGGNFDVQISDVFIVLSGYPIHEKESDPSKIQKYLQMWIGMLYFSIAAASGSNLSSPRQLNNTEAMQRALDRFVLSVDRVFIRFEDSLSTHVRQAREHKPMCGTLYLLRVELRAPTSQELIDDEILSPNSSKLKPSKKVIKAVNLAVTISEEESLSKLADSQLCDQFVQQLFSTCPTYCALGPVTFSVNILVAFNRVTQVFGPVHIVASFDRLDVRLSDEQIVYLVSFFQSYVHQVWWALCLIPCTIY